MGNKMKTHKGAAKRFKKTSKGKYKYKRPKRNHLMTKKSSEKKKNLRKDSHLDNADAKKLKTLMPYD